MAAVIKWEPFKDLEHFFDERFPVSGFIAGGWDFAVDMYEEGNNLVAEMNLPGVEMKHVHVSVEDGHLRITGKREETKEKKRKHYYAREVQKGHLERMVRLPAEINEKKIRATYTDGVLKIVMPRTNKRASKKVPVKVTKK